MDHDTQDRSGTPHGRMEDVYAVMVGSILLSLGLAILGKAGLTTGGVAGIALVLSYVTGWPPGVFLVSLTVPALIFAVRPLGRAFAVKTLCVSLLVLAMTFHASRALVIGFVDHATAAIVGGITIGMGALALARHGAATGGSGVVILWLYRARGWNAGRSQMLLDGMVLLGSLVVIDASSFLWSLLSLASTATILAIWHRPGLYTGY